MGKKYIEKCKYCGKSVTNGGDICAHCRGKLPLVKKLLAMVNAMKDERDRSGKAEQ